MDTRVAILAIIAHDNGSAQEINCLLYTSPSPRDA